METNNCGRCDVKWKTEISSVKIAIIPANSRPLLQPRFWHVKNRPMPELLTNENNNTIEIIDNQYSLIKSTTVNNEDYLEYNNPDVKLNSDGAIVCDNEDGVFHNNMYSGPGWKKSRIHPNTRTALSRPIKHWRKQLFPRQLNYEATTTSRGRRNSGGLFDKPNGYFITDKIVSKEISCLPIYVNTTKDILNSCVQLDILNYGKITNCSIKTALFKSRPGSYTSNSIYQLNSNKSYLQARSKLYEQLANSNSKSLNYNPNYNPNNNSNPSNCKIVPSIVVNNNHYPISSRTNMRRKSKNAIIQNQYNITNTYGIITPNIKVLHNRIQLVLPLPTANLTANTYIVTSGESVTLIPRITNLFGGMALLNDKRIGLAISYSISPIVTTIYTLRVINISGYSVTSSITITVIPRPTAILSITSGSDTITSGQEQQVTLRSLFTNGTATINELSIFDSIAVANGGTYTISPSATTSYILRVTNSLGFYVESSITINVLQLPTATLSTTSNIYSITQGMSVTLSSISTNGTANLLRASDLLLLISNFQSGQLSPTITTSYILRVTNSVGFYVDSNIITITVVPVPTGTLNLSSSTSAITSGMSVSMSGTFANGTADIIRVSTSNNSQIISTIHSMVNLSQNYSITPDFTTAYRLRVTNSLGYSILSNNTITITVYRVPTATLSITAGSSSITSGQSVTLKTVFTNGTATIDNLSRFNGVAIINNRTYTISPPPPVGINTYILSVTNGAEFSVNSSVTITVYPVPTVETFNLTSSVYTITQSQSVTMSGTFADGTADIIRVSTSDNSTIISTIHSNINLSQSYYTFPDVTSAYRLRVTNLAGYPILSNNTITITVLPLPTATLSITEGSSSITSGQGQEVTLTSFFTNGTATIDNLSTFNGVAVTNNGTYIVSPTVTTPYTLRVVNSLGFSVNSSVTITVVPVPTGTLNLTSSVYSITNGQSVTMSGTFADGTADIIRVSTSDNSTIISTIHSNINLSQSYYTFPDVTSTYRLRVTNLAGYFILSSNTITITVVPMPTATLSITAGSSSITSGQGQEVTLTSFFTNGTATINYASPFNSVAVTNNGTYIVSPTVTTPYTLRVVNSLGFSVNSSVTITVYPVPTGTLNLTSSVSSITNGQSVTMSGTFSNGTADIIKVSSSNNSTIISTIHSNINLSQSYSITPDVTSAYRLRVTNGAEFFILSSNTITITVVPMPTATLSITAGSSSITSGQEVTLTSFFTNGTATINYASPFNSVAVTNNGTYIVSPTVTTTYTLRVVNSLEFSVNSSVTITVYPVPTVETFNLTSSSSTINQYQSVTMSGTFSNGTADIIKVSSSNNSTIISTIHSNINLSQSYSITPGVTSAYRLRVTNGALDSILSSNTITITVVPLTGYYGIITFKLRFGSEYPANTTYDVTMYYGNQTFTSYDNSSDVSHEISELNRLENANSIITIGAIINSIGNFYVIDSQDFYYNNQIENWSVVGDQYKIPNGIVNVPLDFIIEVELNERDD